jgi:hypothetical protein
MPVSIAETIGMFRADLRRVELTLGSRIDTRAAANEACLRDDAQREREAMAAELCRFREEIAHSLADLREELRRQVNEVNDLRQEIRSILVGRRPP